MVVNDNQLIFIIQARVGSTRLPKKVLLTLLEEKTILDIIIDRLKFKFPGNKIILATGNTKENSRLKSVADRFGIGFFTGEEQDVLQRFVSFINMEGFNGKVVRICADNPFLDME